MGEALALCQQNKKTSERQRHISTSDRSGVIGEDRIHSGAPIKGILRDAASWIQDEHDSLDVFGNSITDVKLSGLDWVSNEGIVYFPMSFIATASVAGPRSIGGQLGIAKLGVSYDVTGDADTMLVDKATMDAAKIVVGILADRISNGLPVRHIKVERLEDIDAGLWEELVFVIDVELSSEVANEEWDKIIYEISGIAEKHTDKDVSYSLNERLGIHFTWMMDER